MVGVWNAIKIILTIFMEETTMQGVSSNGSGSQKKKIMIMVVVALVLALAFYAVPRDNKVEAPTSALVRTGCGADHLTVTSPVSGSVVGQAIAVEAVVDNRDANTDCSWTVFEAQAGTIEVRDAQGAVLGQGLLTTEEEWMTSEPVRYTGSVALTAAPSGDLTIVITEENPSGEGTPDTVAIPLVSQ